MNIQITSRKFKAKDMLKNYIAGELETLNKYNDDIIEANVILSFHNMRDSIKTAEITLQVPGKLLKASETSEEFSKSVTLAVEKLVRQLKKLKTKRLAKAR